MKTDKAQSSKIDRELALGLRSGIAALLLCVAAIAGGAWFMQHQSDANTGPVASALPDTPRYTLDTTPDQRSLYTVIETTEKSGNLRRRSTLIKTLTDLGAAHDEASLALKALYSNDFLDPRRLQAGLEITAHFDTTDNALMAISVKPDADHSVLAKRLSDGQFFATSLATKLVPTHRRVATNITTSIYDAALQAGAADQQVVDFAQIFAFDVDFQREIHPGDSFEIVYEAFADERGNPVRNGKILFAALNGRALSRDYYEHTPDDDGVSDYFTRDGKAATRFLMKTPINGARLSSSFGRRRHPISGYSRLHKGTDFAARTGTPIFAAGNGVVERASRYGGYGKYARIQHANGYETAYAHMSRYGPGIRRGKRVRQGDIIGYVGSTGASTGPHLHYEVLINGRHVNAMRLKLPTGRTLEGDLLTTFQNQRIAIDALRRDLGAEIEIATLTPIAANQLQ